MLITFDQIIIFFMIFSRFTGIFVAAPFFNTKQIFSMTKVALIFWMSGLILFLVPLPPSLPKSFISLVIIFGFELLIGIMIGFICDIIISAIEFGGSLIDAQAGLSVASTLDPSTGRNAALFEQFLKWVALMFFIVADGHHIILKGLHSSFELVPVGSLPSPSSGAFYIVQFGSHLFEAAVKLAAPIIIIIFLIDFAFGMLNRIAEQINVFQLGFQLKPIVSIAIFLAMIPILPDLITQMMEYMLENILIFLGHLSGSA
jgi:flagellar biosynthetic protein FliR